MLSHTGHGRASLSGSPGRLHGSVPWENSRCSSPCHSSSHAMRVPEVGSVLVLWARVTFLPCPSLAQTAGHDAAPSTALWPLPCPRSDPCGWHGCPQPFLGLPLAELHPQEWAMRDVPPLAEWCPSHLPVVTLPSDSLLRAEAGPHPRWAIPPHTGLQLHLLAQAVLSAARWRSNCRPYKSCPDPGP